MLEALLEGKSPNDRLFKDPEEPWKRVTGAAGVPDLMFHDLRRTSARSKRAAGVDTSVTMQLMGWKTEAMFRRYGIVAVEDSALALAKQEAYDKGLVLPPELTTKPLQNEKPTIEVPEE